MSVRFALLVVVCSVLAGCSSMGRVPTTTLCDSLCHDSCTPSTPTSGMYCIDSSVVWREVVLEAGTTTEHRFLYAKVPTAQDLCLTLIAGAVGEPTATEVCDRGVRPPLNSGGSYKPGLDISQTYNGSTETTTLKGGFIAAIVEPGTPPQGAAAAVLRPFVIRTPKLPGGGYAGIYVLLSVPDTSGGSLRECIFRPNQEPANCSKWGEDDQKPSNVVEVEWFDGNKTWPFHLDHTAFVDYVDNDANQKIVKDEASFLADVCNFVYQARRNIPTSPGTATPKCAVPTH